MFYTLIELSLLICKAKGITSNSKEIVDECDDCAYGYCFNINSYENPIKRTKDKIIWTTREEGYSTRALPTEWYFAFYKPKTNEISGAKQDLKLS